MHVLPQLRKLEEKWSRELVVLGMHSAKFPSERETENILQAVRRYRVEHPVANDWNLHVWGEYAVRAWPTLVLVDPEGYVVAVESGEIPFEMLDMLVERLVERSEARGVLRRSAPIPTLLRPADGRRLAFPGKVLARDGRLYVADTVNDRLVMADAGGRVSLVVGGGGPGLRDGVAGEARFHGPQGLWRHDGMLYVADAENHAIRAVTEDGETFTVAGTGEQASSFHDGGLALSVELNSPWDLVATDRWMYVAMAGFHQVWRLDLISGRLSPLAGTGREALRDGPADEAFLAQPSGLSLDGDLLWVADSETSAVRSVDLKGLRVDTHVGRGLFDFGDLDGAAERARLQHPLAVAASGNVVYVADTYNHKIKRLLVEEKRVETVAGDGSPGLVDGSAAQARFYEPSGLSLDGRRLYVADTNNHAVRVIDLDAGTVSTVPLEGLR